uniref:Uncharacterized protein n=1 Tax=Tetranychus urticae TaxID=32264 RepID=T1K8M6_TETUR
MDIETMLKENRGNNITENRPCHVSCLIKSFVCCHIRLPFHIKIGYCCPDLVYGVDNLMVIETSVMPEISIGNTALLYFSPLCSQLILKRSKFIMR